MKIALVTPYDYPYPGGVTEHIASLDRVFRQWGHEVWVLAASSKDEDELDRGWRRPASFERINSPHLAIAAGLSPGEVHSARQEL